MPFTVIMTKQKQNIRVIGCPCKTGKFSIRKKKKKCKEIIFIQIWLFKILKIISIIFNFGLFTYEYK